MRCSTSSPCTCRSRLLRATVSNSPISRRSCFLSRSSSRRRGSRWIFMLSRGTRATHHGWSCMFVISQCTARSCSPSPGSPFTTASRESRDARRALPDDPGCRVSACFGAMGIVRDSESSVSRTVPIFEGHSWLHLLALIFLHYHDGPRHRGNDAASRGALQM